MRLRYLLPALALVAAPAFAQDARFGLQGGISLPQGDVKDAVDSKMGFGLGAHVAIDLKGGHVLRPRLDYTSIKGSVSESIGGYSANFDNTVTTTTIGVDYNYYVSGKATQGFYLLAGLGYANTKLESSGSANIMGFVINFNESETEGALALAVGGGFQFTPMVGAELRYTTTKPDFAGESIKNEAINLGVTFRF